MEFKDRLRSARSRAGLSMAQLGNMLSNRVSAQSINKYEQGIMMPSSATLIELSSALGVTLDALMKGEPIELTGIEFRKRAAVTDKEKSSIRHAVLDFAKKCIEIESVLGEHDTTSGLDGVVPAAIDDIEDAEEIADKIRDEFGLGEGPIPSVTNAIESRNIKVRTIEATDGFFGLTCQVARGEKPPIRVIVRRSVNVERDRFTTAHELAHAFIGECRNGKLEKAIDRCAGALLVPAEHFKKEIGTHRGMIAYDEVVRLKHLYAVSAMAIVYRMKDLGIISGNDHRNMFRNPRFRSWLKKEPNELDLQGETAVRERPRRFEEQVYRALAEGMIRSKRAADLLGVSVEDVEFAVWGPEAA